MDAITIRPWPDPVIDTIGHDARSSYVERFWLPTLGPTSVLLLRRIADRLDREPDGFTMPIAETSKALGLGDRRGASGPLPRTFARLGQFKLATEATESLWVRRNLPPVSAKHLRRLPESLQRAHERQAEAERGAPAARAHGRARRTALLLLETGADTDEVDRALDRIGFLTNVRHDATRWALAERGALVTTARHT